MPFDAQNYVVARVTMLEDNEQAAHDVLDVNKIPRRLEHPWNRRLSLAERIVLLSGESIPEPQVREEEHDR